MVTSVDSPPRYPRPRTVTPPADAGSRRARWAPLALVGALIVAISGCGDDDAGSAPAVVVIGDSLLFQSGPEVRRALRDAGWAPVIHGEPGSTITGPSDIADIRWPDRLADLVEIAEPDAVVIELGTNGCGDGCPGLEEAVTALLDVVGDDPEIRWLDVREDAAQPDDPAAVNATLRAAAERRDNLEIVDYDERFNGNDDLLDPDGLHLSRQGEREFAALIVDALPRP